MKQELMKRVKSEASVNAGSTGGMRKKKTRGSAVQESVGLDEG